MPASYVERRINVSFQLGKGSFGGSGFNTVSLKGLRVEVVIDNAGLPMPGATAMIRVYGMTLSQMNELSVAGLLWNNRDNKVQVMAGDRQSGMSEVFNGNILEAYPEMGQAPNTAFVVRAIPGIGLQLKPVQPSSFEGSTDGVEALTAIVQKAGLTVENSGVSAKLVNSYFPGTVWEQISRCIKALDCYAYLDMVANKLAIWPKNGARDIGPTLIAPETGMIGYPEFQNIQIRVRTILDPSIKFGQKIRVKSGLTAADGVWNITYIVYNLASELPEGPWEQSITANRDQGSGAAPTSEGASNNL